MITSVGKGHEPSCEIWPQETSALAVLDSGLADPGGGVRVEAVRR